MIALVSLVFKLIGHSKPMMIAIIYSIPCAMIKECGYAHQVTKPPRTVHSVCVSPIIINRHICLWQSIAYESSAVFPTYATRASLVVVQLTHLIANGITRDAKANKATQRVRVAARDMCLDLLRSVYRCWVDICKACLHSLNHICARNNTIRTDETSGGREAEMPDPEDDYVRRRDERNVGRPAVSESCDVLCSKCEHSLATI